MDVFCDVRTVRAEAVLAQKIVYAGNISSESEGQLREISAPVSSECCHPMFLSSTCFRDLFVAFSSTLDAERSCDSA